MNQFFVTLCILALGDVSQVLGRSDGYHYDKPNIPFELPIEHHHIPNYNVVPTIAPRPPPTPPPHRTYVQPSQSGYHYNPPSRPVIQIRPRPTYSSIAPAYVAPTRSYVAPTRNYVAPIAGPQQGYSYPVPAVSHQQTYVAPIATRPIQKYRERIPYRQAYVQPSYYRPPQQSIQPQRSYGPPPDPYAYTPPRKAFVSPSPSPQPIHQQPQRTYSQSSYVAPTANTIPAGTLRNDGYHYNRPSVSYTPAAPQVHLSAGTLANDGYHYDRPTHNQISAGTLTNDGYHYDRPSHNQISAGTLTNDGYHYDRPQEEFLDNGLQYRKIRRVIYRYKKK